MPISLPLPTAAELQLLAALNPNRHARTAESRGSGLIQPVSAHAAMTIMSQRTQNRRIGIRSAMLGNAVLGGTKSALGSVRDSACVHTV
jgi:hypothetical protein